MGILGKDLFDIDRPRTHVKVQFGQSAYWVEHDPAPHPYGETLTELLNYDVTPYEHTLSALKQAMEEKDAQAAPRAFMDAVRDLSSLPYFRLFLSDLRQFNELPVECFVVGEARAAFEAYILSDGKKDAAYMREQAGAVRNLLCRVHHSGIANRYSRNLFVPESGRGGSGRLLLSICR